MTRATNPRRSVTFYTCGVIVAFPVSLAFLPAGPGVVSPALAVVLVGLGLLSGARPIRIPRMRHEIQATHPFILLALAAVGTPIAVAVAVAGVCGAMLGRHGPTSWSKLGFNISAVGLSTAIAGSAFAGSGGVAGQPLTTVLVPLFAATTAYLLCNTGFVAIVIALDKRQSLTRVWHATFSYTLVSYFAGLTLAVAMLAVESRLLPWGLLLATASFPMFLSFYRKHASSFTANATN